jgi:methylated-DNA-protein-cysteine methyltransferase-like protein
MREPNSYNRIYEIVKKIPSGKVATYGQIARLVGLSGHARQVGYALHNLPSTSDVPWQRVINGQGRISFPVESVEWNMQKSMLESEGIQFSLNNTVSLHKYQWKPL